MPLWDWEPGRIVPTHCYPGYREFIVHPKCYPRTSGDENSRPIDLHKVAENSPLDQKPQYQAYIRTCQGDILISGWQG